MTVYMPVLQAREAELVALGKMDRLAVPLVSPVLEAVCYSGEDPLWRTSQRLAMLAAQELLKGTVPAVDCVHLDRRYGIGGLGRQMPMHEVSGAFKQMLIPIRPAVRVTATGSASPEAWQAAAEVAQLNGKGACLRVVLAGVSGRALPTLIDQVAAAVDRLGCRADQLDLLIDLGPMLSRSRVSPAVQAARVMATALADVPWRHAAVAAAAFPDSITSVPLGGCVQFPRLDADIWRQLRTHEQPWASTLGFGDYGVAGTRLPRSGRPAPNLRYTADVCWHTYRYPKDADGKFSTFHDLCREVTGTLWWAGENYSWGDDEIALRAKGHGGPGGPAQWRAFSLSHHLAVVLEELRRPAR